MKLFSPVLALVLALCFTGCGSDGSSTGEPAQGEGATKPADSSTHSSTSSSGSSSSSMSSTSGGAAGAKSLGENCTASSECQERKCVRFKDNQGVDRGFCSRTCTKAADCPENGYVCNLSPYTACVPGN